MGGKNFIGRLQPAQWFASCEMRWQRRHWKKPCSVIFLMERASVASRGGCAVLLTMRKRRFAGGVAASASAGQECSAQLIPRKTPEVNEALETAAAAFAHCSSVRQELSGNESPLAAFARDPSWCRDNISPHRSSRTESAPNECKHRRSWCNDAAIPNPRGNVVRIEEGKFDAHAVVTTLTQPPRDFLK